MGLKKIKACIAVMMITLFLVSDACAVTLMEWLLCKEVILRTRTKILVHRLSGQVKYYWQSGRMMDDPDYDPEKGGSWRPVAGDLRAQFQKQYNAERGLR